MPRFRRLQALPQALSSLPKQIFAYLHLLHADEVNATDNDLVWEAFLRSLKPCDPTHTSRVRVPCASKIAWLAPPPSGGMSQAIARKPDSLALQTTIRALDRTKARLAPGYTMTHDDKRKGTLSRPGLRRFFFTFFPCSQHCVFFPVWSR